MDYEILIRLTLVGIGIVFLILSAVGAILSLAQGTGRVSALGVDSNPLGGITKFIEALTAFLKALTSAPQWLALIIIGVLLIFLGAFMPLPF